GEDPFTSPGLKERLGARSRTYPPTIPDLAGGRTYVRCHDDCPCPPTVSTASAHRADDRRRGDRVEDEEGIVPVHGGTRPRQSGPSRPRRSEARHLRRPPQHHGRGHGLPLGGGEHELERAPLCPAPLGEGPLPKASLIYSPQRGKARRQHDRAA